MCQGIEDCGSVSNCYCFKDPYAIDCSKRGLERIPDFDDSYESLTQYLFLNDNDIKEIREGYFNHWISLIYVDLRGNNNLDCKTLDRFPVWVATIIADCQEIQGSTRAIDEHMSTTDRSRKY